MVRWSACCGIGENGRRRAAGELLEIANQVGLVEIAGIGGDGGPPASVHAGEFAGMAETRMRHKFLGPRPLSSKQRRRNWRGLIPACEAAQSRSTSPWAFTTASIASLTGSGAGGASKAEASIRLLNSHSTLLSKSRRVDPRGPRVAPFFPSIPPAGRAETAAPSLAESARRWVSIRAAWQSAARLSSRPRRVTPPHESRRCRGSHLV